MQIDQINRWFINAKFKQELLKKYEIWNQNKNFTTWIVELYQFK